jgi:sporulation integral membrane protein YlbJ
MKKNISLLMTLALFLALSIFSDTAAQGARQSLSLCAATLIPSLFPFFVLAALLSALGLPDLLARRAGGIMRRVFHVSGSGAQAFFLGISWGYPLGASVVAQLRRSGQVTRDEAERLLPFCNNSGPAFIIGAMGGVFHSVQAGLLLYITHVTAALLLGLLLRPPAPERTHVPPNKNEGTVSFAAAFGPAVAGALRSTLTVCSYVVLFGALMGMLTPLQKLPPLGAALAAGVLELGSGAAALSGMSPTPLTLAVAALLLGWGGISVHCQTMALIADTDIKIARHLWGRAVCGVIAAVLTFCAAWVLMGAGIL